MNIQVVDDALAGVDAAHELGEPRVVYFQAITDYGSGLCVDRFVVDD